jgi:hypothetical protein
MKIRESDLIKQCIAAASHNGATVWRNNNGTLKDASGRFIRFGVGPKGSSDLIGLTDARCAKGAGLFCAFEVKVPGWKPSGEKQIAHHARQEDFINFVKMAGGVAGFVSSYEDVKALLTTPP